MKKLLILFIVIFMASFAFGQKIDTFTLSSGETVSDSVSLDGKHYPISLIIPQGVTDTLMFQVADVGSTWYPLKSSGSDYYILVDSSEASAYTLDPDVFFPWRWFKVESNDAASEDETFRVQSIKR